MKYLFPVLILIALLLFSCNEDDDGCFGNGYPILDNANFRLNFVDRQTNENLLIGANPVLKATDIQLLPSSTWSFPFEFNQALKMIDGDSILIIGMQNNNDGYDVITTLIIEYNDLYPADTLHIEYLRTPSHCGVFDEKYYNIRNNETYLCRICDEQIIDIKK